MFSHFFHFWFTKPKSVGIVWCLILEYWTIPTIFSFSEVKVIFHLSLMIWFCTKLYIRVRYVIHMEHLYVSMVLCTGSCIVDVSPHLWERWEKSLKIQLCIRKIQGEQGGSSSTYRMGAFLGTFLEVKKIDFQGKGGERRQGTCNVRRMASGKVLCALLCHMCRTQYVARVEEIIESIPDVLAQQY